MGIFHGLIEDILAEKKDSVNKKIKILKDEGYDQDQAVAIALSMKERGELKEEEEELEEISAMAGGAVQGYSLPQVAKPKYPKKNKNDKLDEMVNEVYDYLLETFHLQGASDD